MNLTTIVQNKKKLLSWTCRLVGAAIMGQTLFFKFSGAPESIYIFTKVGMEPWGRLITGSVELIASLCLLWSPLSWLGSFLSSTVMVGAIFSHLTLLGIEVQGDGGLLFSLACVVFCVGLVNLYLERGKIPLVGELLSSEKFSELSKKLKIRNIGLGYLFLLVCISIALTGVAQEIYTISKIAKLSTSLGPEVKSITQVAYFLSICGIFFSFILAMGLLRLVGKPIADFTGVCGQVMLGEHKARVHIRSSAELNVMAVSFNQMLDEIQLKDANMRSLLGGISDAVFFFDQQGQIPKEHSKAAEIIFPNFGEITQVTQFFEKYFHKTSESIKEVLHLIWDPASPLDFASIADLLPKAGIISGSDSSSKDRFLSLKYRPEKSPQGQLLRVIVVATDRSQEELASRETAKQREKVARLALISSGISDFRISLDEMENIWKKLNELLSPSSNRGQSLDDQAIRRLIHSVKGGFAAYEFKALASRIHELETKLSGKNIGQMVSETRQILETIESDFRASVKEVEEVFNLNEEKNWVRVASSKLSHMDSVVNKKADPELKQMVQNLREKSLDQLLVKHQRYLNSISERDGTKIVKIVVAPESIELDPQVILSLDSSLGHLFRNSFDHGIEAAEERESNGKPAEGTILVHAMRESQGNLKLSIRDDGRGIQTVRLVDKAIKAGIWTEEKAKTASDSEKLNLILASGLSTQDQVSETSGRGVGMDAVKADIESRGGNLSIKTWLGKGTEFTIVLA